MPHTAVSLHCKQMGLQKSELKKKASVFKVRLHLTIIPQKYYPSGLSCKRLKIILDAVFRFLLK